MLNVYGCGLSYLAGRVELGKTGCSTLFFTFSQQMLEVRDPTFAKLGQWLEIWDALFRTEFCVVLCARQ